MRRAPFYAGLALLTFSTLMLEVIETRLLSVMTWYHLAFFIISAAMFGMTAGAIWVYERRESFRRESLPDDLASLTCGFALATGASLVVQTTLATAQVVSVTFVFVYLELALAVAAPFFFSGAAVSLALTRSPFPIGRVYAADLVGAALGCLGVLVALGPLDAPSAILLAGALGAAAALLFAASASVRAAGKTAGARHLVARPGLLFIAMTVVALLNGLTRHGIQPIEVKSAIEQRSGGVLLERWNSFSRVVAYAPIVGPPGLWGPSSALPPGTVRQIWMNIDGDAATVMFRFDGNVDRASYLRYDITNLGYSIRHSGRAVVLGVGSGRDVLSAWVAGFRDITGVELNPTFVDLLTRRAPFRDFAGLFGLPGVRFIMAEARSWMARTRETFDLVQMSMVDTFAATGAGAFTLTENGLYTEEAWSTFLARLRPGGLFSVSRWHAAGEVNETGRTVSLATAVLLASNVTDPRRHIFLASAERCATLLVGRDPLRPEDVTTLRGICRDRRYQVLLSPDSASSSPVLERIVSAGSRDALIRATSDLPLDLSPPTDDRPFFFNILPLSKPLLAWRFLGGPDARAQTGVLRGNVTATLTLLTILLVSLLLVATTIVVPLRPALREAGRRLVLGGTAYFALLGLGFMFVEMGLLQRCTTFLGHPVYSLSVVLFSLILATGAGSWLSESFPLRSQGWLLSWALAIACIMAVMPWLLPALFGTFASASTLVRCALVTAAITPGGLLMGFGFPTGMRLVSAVDQRPTAWFWGVNGAAGVLGSVLAVVLSITAGISTTLLLGALCYLALVPAAAVIGFTRAPAGITQRGA